ncbi:tripartite tricarboxylate transporter substrate binding protein [Cupriavidus respiraculi]|uniref:tripartite tricarboxylate transporter substrate binding protein n=1 Tax=Cupriavidus respiraculi TaxID=195930 RepID=UPI001C97A3AF|nr:tripartite tricarboxylate transporter substrate binding protein [Cupriavidus respiraculi]MBY4947289.1 tripartite tricarboxylate transporter substrate binding protein [Cupriavidus respiraculi]
MIRKQRLLAGLIAAAGIALAAAASAGESARDFPSRPLRIVVPFTPGSGSDNSARYYGEALARELGQPVVVENKPGANGVIGIQAVNSAPADGYTILLASNSPISVNPIVTKNLPYDPLTDLRPISGLSRNMNVFLVPLDSPLKSVGDLAAAAKRQDRALNIGTYSAGYQLAAAWFGTLAGIRFNNIPYKGQAQIMTDILGKQLDLALVDTGGALPLLRQGKLRALAVSGEQRHPELPDVPTVRESGYADFVQYSWVSFYVRAQTPDDIVARLASTMQAILKRPESAAYLAKAGSSLMPYDPDAMRRFQEAETARFRKVAQATGIRAE